MDVFPMRVHTDRVIIVPFFTDRDHNFIHGGESLW